MKVLDALQITMSIPFMFKPVFYNNSYYVDGGIYNPYPIKYAKNLKKTIGIFLKKDNYELDKKIIINSLNSYIIQVLVCFYDEFKQKIINKKKYRNCTIIVNAEMFSSVNLKLNKEDKQNIINIGRNSSIKYMENKFNKIRLAYLIKKNFNN